MRAAWCSPTCTAMNISHPIDQEDRHILVCRLTRKPSGGKKGGGGEGTKIGDRRYARGSLRVGSMRRQAMLVEAASDSGSVRGEHHEDQRTEEQRLRCGPKSGGYQQPQVLSPKGHMHQPLTGGGEGCPQSHHHFPRAGRQNRLSSALFLTTKKTPPPPSSGLHQAPPPHPRL